MENATKALLIAAAVLIAILIISFALIIYNMASETVGNVNLSEAEMTQFNVKFKVYEGKVVTSQELNKIARDIIIHNQQESVNNTNRYVKLVNSINGSIWIDESKDKVDPLMPDGRTLKLKCHYNNGLIDQIIFTFIRND